VRVGVMLLRLLGRTWRIRRTGAEHFERRREGGPATIFAFWHGQILPMLWVHRGIGAHVLISRHADGEIITRITESFGYLSVRGSTRRGGATALREIDRLLASGGEIAFTPDGPRGPRHSFAPGALVAAHRNGARLLLMGAEIDRAWRLRSWDRFEIPKPFARITVHYAPPVPVPAEDVEDPSVGGERWAARLNGLVPNDE
jgi:lysophospholipid acyltransferase (LPLAT)-like uncharacterized protein